MMVSHKQIVIVMGIQCSGKSTVVKDYVDKGYTRLNRDDSGSSLEKLNLNLEQKIKEGKSTLFVLDNTYGKKEQRSQVIDIAKKYGFSIVCHLMDTTIEEAQFNSAWRILSLNSNDIEPSLLLGPDGSRLFPSPDHVPAIAQFAYKKSFEKPTTDEGFDSVTTIPFKRNLPSDYVNKAVILDYDGTIRYSSGKEKFPITPDEVKLLPNRTETLNKWKNNGYKLLGISNQSGIEKGQLTNDAAIACFKRTNELLGLDIDVKCCPHHSFPIRCYCRKPLPGLSVYLIRKYKLNPSECIIVGDQKTDETLAKRSGMQFVWANNFFV